MNRKDTIQLEQNPDANERHFVNECKRYRLELERDAPKTAEELLKLHDEKLRQKAAQMPAYERD